MLGELLGEEFPGELEAEGGGGLRPHLTAWCCPTPPGLSICQLWGKGGKPEPWCQAPGILLSLGKVP